MRRGQALRGGGTLAALLVLGPALVAGGVANGRPAEAPEASVPTPSGSSGMPLLAPPGEGVVDAQVAVAPVTLELELSQRAARAGQRVHARVTLVNQTGGSLATITVTLHGPASEVVVDPAHARVVRRLATGAAATVGWTVCGRGPGAYALVATASVDGMTLTSDPRLFTVTATGSC